MIATSNKSECASALEQISGIQERKRFKKNPKCANNLIASLIMIHKRETSEETSTTHHLHLMAFCPFLELQASNNYPHQCRNCAKQNGSKFVIFTCIITNKTKKNIILDYISVVTVFFFCLQ